MSYICLTWNWNIYNQLTLKYVKLTCETEIYITNWHWNIYTTEYWNKNSSKLKYIEGDTDNICDLTLKYIEVNNEII